MALGSGVTIALVLVNTGTVPVQTHNGDVRRASSRSGNKATRPIRSRETLPLAGFSFVWRSLDVLNLTITSLAGFSQSP